MDKLKPIGKDGVDFINIYSKGKTDLGKYLTNWATQDIQISIGKFKSIEGLIFFLGSFDNELRSLSGFNAKKRGEELDRGIRLPEDVFRGYIKEAMRDVAKQLAITPGIIRTTAYKVTDHNLPLVHYYEYGDKRVVPKKWLWQIEAWEQILKEEFK
jgi:hypothetical protein